MVIPRHYTALILPEWNVNDETSISSETSESSFNLTRVECKWLLIIMTVLMLLSFNLTRVECKWIYLSKREIKPFCFNLTRVECKFGSSGSGVVAPDALILPEWNVNKGYDSPAASALCFNLTRVECKYDKI